MDLNSDYLYLVYIFVIPLIAMVLIYVVFRRNLRKAGYRPTRRRPTQLNYNRGGSREVIFWPREEDMPSLGRMLRAEVVSDPQLGSLIMKISSQLSIRLLCLLNLLICVLCVDALVGGTLIMTSLTYSFFELPRYKEIFALVFGFMTIWGFLNVYRASKTIFFYEHGIMLTHQRNVKYDYNDIVQVEVVENKRFGHKSTICRISFKNHRELIFDSRQYADLHDKILFWRQNLVWAY